MANGEPHWRSAGLGGEHAKDTSCPRVSSRCAPGVSDLAQDVLGALVVKILRQQLRSKVLLLGVVLAELIALYFTVRGVWSFRDYPSDLPPVLANLLTGLLCGTAWGCTPALGYWLVEVELRRETPALLTLAGISPGRFLVSTTMACLCFGGLVCVVFLPFLTLAALLGAHWLELGSRIPWIVLAAIPHTLAGVCLGTFAKSNAARAASVPVLAAVSALGVRGMVASMSGAAGFSEHLRTVAVVALLGLPVLWFFVRRNARQLTAQGHAVFSVADWAAARRG